MYNTLQIIISNLWEYYHPYHNSKCSVSIGSLNPHNHPKNLGARKVKKPAKGYTPRKIAELEF